MMEVSATDRRFSPRKPWSYGDRNVLRRRRCINCGSRRVAKVLYGLAGSSVEPDLAEGNVVLGGCCVDPAADPQRMCLDCGTLWGQWVAPHCTWPYEVSEESTGEALRGK